MLLLLMLCTVAYAIPQCKVPGVWGTCRSGLSYPMSESSEWDSGRSAMSYSMQLKYDAAILRDASPRSRDSDGYVPCVGGLAGNIPCRNVDQLSFVNFVDLGYKRMTLDVFNAGNDIWGWTDPMTGDEYAIIGLTGGTSFVRVTDPTNPLPVAFMYTTTLATIWRDIKVIGNFAYIGSEANNHGIQIFDLTRLRGVQTLMPEVEPDALYDVIGSSHNVVANEETNFLYVVGASRLADFGCKGGLHAVDVSDPLNPTFAGCYDADGYTHDAQCVIYRGPDARYYEREVCFNFNEDSLTIVDVTDKSDMKMISKMGYYGVQYSHQGWLSSDQSLLLLDDELDEQEADDAVTKTYIWDVHDLTNPVLRRTFRFDHNSIDHNQYTKGQFTYQANYESGLRILHINQNTYDMQEVAFFDVYPEDTRSEFNGAWSVYPYFNSGTVVISSIDYGLFVVRPNYSAMQAEAAGGV